ncbi:hypothetical protein [Roseivirga misakiensis]|uniref:hypothetical protein n=1 Tax=Roseivirga misakiensis TaxID=1563681 RepID=UPI00159EFA99|nr:hypothetical protein [Roseivirga misakiensis]
MLKQLKRSFFLIIALVFINANVFAQCAMCRGSVESTVAAGETSMASNLNLGILYLFFAPYTLVCLIAYLWYKKSRRNVNKVQRSSGIAG